MPAGMCSACALRNVTPKGDFKNCKSIYNLDSAQCKSKLQEYAQKNQCDTKRKSQVNEWSAASKQKLDYFVYAVCEQCCDCIPKGATAAQYGSRKNQKKLFHPERGNCPAHAFYDICKVLPNIKYMALGNAPFKGGWGHACGHLRKWFNSPAATNWLSNHNAKMIFNIKQFLGNVNVANQCGSKAVWTRCVDMEKKQRRI
ncbi:unnamed protein product [Agarophyton chilense]